VVFCGEEGVIYSPLDGKRKRGTRLQRLQNLETNPQASVLLDEYCEDWQRLWWVRIDGDADWCEPAEPLAGTIADRLVEKYRQYRGTGITFDPTGYLRVRPTKVTAWSQTGSLAAIVAAIP
jgi:PPOX class probable F420-dependent enzyme